MLTTVSWTYELPLPDEGSEGLEEYEAQAATGEDVGRVLAVVRRGEETYLLVECSRMPPLTHHLHAFPWAEVADVDHADLRVRLRVPADRIEEVGVELDPHRMVRGPEAEARRVTQLPTALVHGGPAGGPGPFERASFPAAILFWALGSFSLLVVIALVSIDFAVWKFAFFALPVAHWAVAFALTGYRLYREPYARHRRSRT